MELTPYSSHTHRDDDFVVFSDSDGASQSSLDFRHSPRRSHRASVPDSPSPASVSPRRARKTKPTTEETPSPKTKRVRRRSTKSADGASVRSHRSSRHEYPMGTGYTLMPATGKIFRNLLILEESLRAQVIQQRALRRKYLTFLAVLCSLIAWISHHLFLVDPRYSSQGTARVVLQFVLLALLVTLMLYHLLGEYQKTIVLPRKFLSSTNKGLRQLNVRLVKIKTPWSDSIIDVIRELLLFTATMCLNCLHKAYPSTVKNRHSRLEVFLVSCQLQCQPRIGVTDVKLVLNARLFNTDVREGWELYRSEFWIHEGVRRRNHMLAFLQEEQVLDRGKLLKRDKKERRDRRKSVAAVEPQNPEDGASRESSPDQFPVVNSPVSNKLSEQNLQKLSSEYEKSFSD
ncbi:Spo7-domain-containing protein [Suhomyces tanzawaensis NRRL Y-17324]|uniref:Spo7-domain-containing protein n=1 Tax=Suhomyces tanzawaensis NRRL Y-17324 TaxID=984487 RepID=A0A1E4SAW7_9ASCO|nr:Spo7-domain-containing protein [Suhomyces tanzawaensis NRRL Y-17324]ODV76641.1 Spo7-domain-containing protein [Suhomyces tanzawaensis NRRL Y-17324]